MKKFLILFMGIFQFSAEINAQYTLYYNSYVEVYPSIDLGDCINKPTMNAFTNWKLDDILLANNQGNYPLNTLTVLNCTNHPITGLNNCYLDGIVNIDCDLSKLDFGILHRLNFDYPSSPPSDPYPFPATSLTSIDLNMVKGWIQIGISPPIPDEIFKCLENGTKIGNFTFTEGEQVYLSTSSSSLITFLTSSNLYSYQIEWRADGTDTWKAISGYPFTIPYLELTEFTELGRTIHFRSRISRINGAEPVKFSPYFELYFEVLKKVDVTCTSIEDCYCTEKFANGHFNVKAVEPGGYVEFIIPGNPDIPGSQDIHLKKAFENSDNFEVSLPIGNYTLLYEYWGLVPDGNINIKRTGSQVLNIAPIERTLITNTNITPVKCFGENNGTIEITASNGFPDYKFTLGTLTQTSTSGVTFSGLAAKNYTIDVIDNKGCKGSTGIVTVNQPPELSLSAENVTKVKCNGGSDGEVVLSALGGTSPYSFRMNNSSWQTSNIFSDLSQGTYIFDVKDTNNCQKQITIDIMQPEPLSIGVESYYDVSCFNGNNGSITLSANGGTTPYNFSNDRNNWQTSPVFSGLIIGSYELHVKDDNGCESSTNQEIFQPKVLKLSIKSTIQPSCYGFNDGNVELSATGGKMQYQFSKDGDMWQDDSTFLGMEAKSYKFLIKDSNECKDSVDANISQPSPLTISVIAFRDVDCRGEINGSITVNSDGGTMPYNFSKDGYNWQDSNLFSNLTAGKYTIDVNDNNGCEALVSHEILEPSFHLSVVTAKLDVTCFNANNGSVELTAGGGTAPYKFSKDNGTSFVSGSSPYSFSGLAPGLYNIVIKDANECEFKPLPVTITQPSELNAIATKEDISCYDENNGNITITVSGGTSPYQYSSDNGLTFTSPTTNLFYKFTGLNSGNYVVVARDKNNCQFILSNQITITQPSSPLSAMVSIINVDCYNANNGSITVSSSGGTAPYWYSKDFGITYISGPNIYTFSDLMPGVYGIVVKDSHDCKFNINPTTITQPQHFALAISNWKDVSCPNESDGWVEVTASGGTPEYSFCIDGNMWLTELSPFKFENLSSKSYTLKVKDTKGCEVTIGHQVNQPNPISITNTIANVICKGDSNGKISFTVIGGTKPYTLKLTGTKSYLQTVTNIDQKAEFIGLEADSYTLTISDQHGCTKTAEYIVKEPNVPLSLSIKTKLDPSCNGYSNGTVELESQGGWGNYTYILQSNDLSNHTGKFSGFSKGSYSFRVIDSLGCTTSIDAIFNEPNPLELSDPMITNLKCFEDGTGRIKVSATGGTSPYVFSFDGSQFTSLNEVINLQAGIDSIVVKDSKGCLDKGVAKVTQPDFLNLSVYKSNHNGFNIKCFNGIDTIRAVPFGGTPPYILDFNGKSIVCAPSGYTLKDLSAGVYDLKVTDKNLCSYSTNFSLTEPPLLTLDEIDVDSVLCNNTATGKVAITLKGGVPNYSHNLFDSQLNILSISSGINPHFTNLLSGDYLIKSADGNGCVDSILVKIYQPAPLNVNFDIKNVTCFGAKDGNAEAKIVGGTKPYSCQWIGDDSKVINQTSIITGSGEFTYKFLLTDKNGCAGESSKMGQLDTLVKISNPERPLSLDASISKVLCHGKNSGTIDLISLGGWKGYSYSINNGPFYQNPKFTDLSAGQYEVQIKDSLGCIYQKKLTVEQNDSLTFTADVLDVTCFGGQNGTIQVLASGGTPGYSYLINGEKSEGKVDTLTAGEYELKVSDIFGCQVPSKMVSIGSPTPLNYTANVINSNCNLSNGSIVLTPSGGTSPYSIEWYKNSVLIAKGNQLVNQPSDLYLSRITDDNNCPAQFSVAIPDDGSPNITLNALANTLCPNGSDGSVTIDAKSGILPYDVSLFKGSDQLSVTNYTYKPDEIYFSNLNAGNYSVMITDGNRCKSINQFEITSPPRITASIISTDISCFNGKNGSASLTLSGGTAPYHINWFNSSNEMIGTDPKIENVKAGDYSYQVTDYNGCYLVPSIPATNSSIAISNPPTPLTLGISSTSNVTCYKGKNGGVRLNSQGGWGNYTFSIDSGITWLSNPNFSNLIAGNYTFTLKDAFGCTDTLTTIVKDGIPININIDKVSDVTCFGTSTGSITLSASGGNGFYNYSINDGLNFTVNRYFSNLVLGDYTIRVKDIYGCDNFRIQRIDQPKLLEATLDQVFSAACNKPIGSASVNVFGGTSPYTYRWNNGQNQRNAIMLIPGTYSVDIKDANGCNASTSVIVGNIPGPRIELVSKSDATCSYLNNGTITASVSSGTTPLNLIWKGTNSNSTSIQNLNRGTYTAIVSDFYGCSDSINVTISKPDSLFASILKTANPLCNGFTNGVIEVSANGGSSPYSYLWSNGSRVSTTGDIPSGKYSLNLTDSKGCQFTTFYSVIDPPLLKPNIPNQVTICSNQTYYADAGIMNVDYLWHSENGFSSLSKTPSLVSPGVYYLLITDTNGCIGKDTLTLSKENSIIDANFMIPNKASVGDTIVLIEMSWPVPQSIDWHYPASFISIYRNDYSIYLVPQVVGTFNIGLTSFVSVCSEYLEKSIAIEAKKDKGTQQKSIQSIINEVKAYPNPNKGDFTIEVNLNRESDILVELYTPIGRRLGYKEGKGLSSYKFNFNVYQVPGIYLVRISSGNEFKSLRIAIE